MLSSYFSLFADSNYALGLLLPCLPDLFDHSGERGREGKGARVEEGDALPSTSYFPETNSAFGNRRTHHSVYLTV